MGLICRLPDVLGKPIVRIVEDVYCHPHYSDMVRQVPNYLKGMCPERAPKLPCSLLYDRGEEFFPRHVWLTERDHAIYDGWAVEILGFDGDYPDYVPQPHSLNQSTDLIQRQREYLQRIRPSAPAPVPEPDPVQEPLGVKPVPSVGSSGWLCPKGRFYACLAWHHDEWEVLYGRHFSSYRIQSVGWVVVSEGTIKGQRDPTQDQLDTLFDLGLYTSVEVYNFLYSRP